MTGAAAVALLPLLAPAAGAVLLLVVLAVRRTPGGAFAVAALSLLAGLASLPLAARVAPRPATDLLVVDAPGLVVVGALLAATLAVAVLAREYLERGGHGRPEELYLLLLLAAVGGATLPLARHLVSFFLGLELLSVGLYGLVAYLREERPGLEAGVKYLLLAGASSAFLLFGVALIHLATGSLAFPRDLSAASGPYLAAGSVLLLVAVGFKLGLAPFHMWAADVYQGAPAPVAAFVATVSKAAVVAVLLRLLTTMGATPEAWPAPLWLALAGLAGASMVVGNALALLQDDLKRILGYSSIAHLGYLMVPLLAGGAVGVTAALFYLLVYMATMLTAFAAVSVLSAPGREAHALEAYRGLWWRRPGVAAALTVSLLSLAGIPVTGGFLAKVHLVGAGMAGGLRTLVLVLVATSVLGLFYYLRVLSTLFAPVEDAPSGATAPDRLLPLTTRVAGAVLAALALLLLWLGAWPEPLLRLLGEGVGALVP